MINSLLERTVHLLPISEMVQFCCADWGTSIDNSAKPSLRFLLAIESKNLSDDRTKNAVSEFLENSNNWNSGIAKVIKKEFRRRLDNEK